MPKKIESHEALDLIRIGLRADGEGAEKIKEIAKKCKTFFSDLPECEDEKLEQILMILIPYLRPSAKMISELGKAGLYEIYTIVEKNASV